MRLVHGENPRQTPATLRALPSARRDPLAIGHFRIRGTRAPCYTNVADADTLLQTLSLAAEAFRQHYGKTPYLAIAAKHGNACGAAADWRSPRRALEGALFGNPQAIWGGEIAVTFDIDGDLARRLLFSARRLRREGRGEWMLDLVLAPRFTAEAETILASRKAQKRFSNPALRAPRLPRAAWAGRLVRGGALRQPWPTYVLDVRGIAPEAPLPAGERFDSLILAWAVAFSSFHGGNEIALAKGRKLLSVGGGPSTVDAAETAVSRARRRGHDPAGSVFCANAFFPFPDAPRILARAKVGAGCAPLGSRRDALVVSFFKRAGVSMTYLPPDVRGFSRH